MKPLLITIVGLTAGIAPAALDFNLNFKNINSAGVTWNADQISVVTQAANEWGSLFALDYTIDVDLTFTTAGTSGYLAQWAGRYAPGTTMGDTIRPWENTTHEIRFNADLMSPALPHYLWFDDDTSTDAVANNQWDALTVARHEFGHLVGFSADFYVDEVQTDGEVAFWEDLIDNADVFDPTGLGVLLEDDHGHISAASEYTDDLMLSTLQNGTRRGISDLNLEMLELAYGYQFVETLSTQGGVVAIPEPRNLSLSAALLVCALVFWRRQPRA